MTAVLGIGLSQFGRQPGLTGLDLGFQAARAALEDAQLSWSDVDAAFGGSDASGNADTLVSRLGLTGLPFINVKNGCATGGSALAVANDAIRSGRADVVLVVGFDKHPAGAFDPMPQDWGLEDWYGTAGLMVTTQFFAMKLRRYMHDHGVSREVLAMAAARSFRNGAANPKAWRRKALSTEEILASPVVNDPLTQYMFCSPGEGAAAIVLANDRRSSSSRRSVYLRSIVTATRRTGSFEVFSPGVSGSDPTSVTEDASRAAFEAAGIGPSEVQVIQVQDTEVGAELMHLAECGFCEHGEQEDLVRSRALEITGRLPANTDGGCIANGEPIGASGLRQVCEVVIQIRGEAGARQVPGEPLAAFTHVYGAPGVSACAVLSR